MATTFVSKAFTSAGTKLAVSANAPTTYDSTGFAALTFTEVGEITNMGTFGKTYNLVTHNPLGDRKTVKRKGAYNNGELQLQMARVPEDAGQTVLVAGLDSDNSYSFKVTLQDGTVQYFSAQIMSYTTNIGTVDQITAAEVSVQIDNAIVEVAAP